MHAGYANDRHPKIKKGGRLSEASGLFVSTGCGTPRQAANTGGRSTSLTMWATTRPAPVYRVPTLPLTDAISGVKTELPQSCRALELRKAQASNRRTLSPEEGNVAVRQRDENPSSRLPERGVASASEMPQRPRERSEATKSEATIAASKRAGPDKR